MIRAAWPMLLLFAALGASCTFDPVGVEPGHDASVGLPTDADTNGADAAAALVDGAPVTAPDAQVADATPPAPDARGCPSNYTVLPSTGHAYRLRRTKQPWFQAADSCMRNGPGIHLAIIDDAAELAEIDAFVDVSPAWIGVNDVANEGQFVLVTGGPATYLPWAPGEPNNQNNEDCVELVGNAFNDDACDTPLPFVCECE